MRIAHAALHTPLLFPLFSALFFTAACKPGGVEWCGEHQSASGGYVHCADPGVTDLEAFREMKWKPPKQKLFSVKLELKGTQIRDISPLASFPRIFSLNLEGAPVSDITALSAHEVFQLNLSNTKVSDLKPLRGNGELGILDLDNTKVADLTPLARSRNLSRLSIKNTPVDDLAPLQSLGKLKALDAGGTRVRDLRPLRKLRALTSLDLRDTLITDISPLQKLERLERLDLSGTKVTDLTPLHELSRLRFLRMKGADLSAASIKALKAELPGLNIITL